MQCTRHARTAAILLNTCGLALTSGVLAAQTPTARTVATFVDSAAAMALRNGSLPSLSIAVARGSKILIDTAYGYADLENKVSATPETVYRIGSDTKQFTAAAIMRLVEQGKLHLDDDVRQFFPNFPFGDRHVTVRQLLTHTSGVSDYLAPMDANLEREYLSHDSVLATIREKPFGFEPGTRWSYSNTGYYMLGMIIEQVSGRSYQDYLQQTFFTPLGLRHTYYCHAEPLIEHRAHGYSDEHGKVVNTGYFDISLAFSAGGLCSTPRDLITWSRALREGRVVSAVSYREMSTAGLLADGTTFTPHYGFGLMLADVDGHRQVFHGGGINGFAALVSTYPDDSVYVVALTNSDAPGAMQMAAVAQGVSRLVLGLPPKPFVIPGRTGGPPVQSDTVSPHVDSLFASLNHPESPGCQLGVIRDGRTIYEHGYGSANLDDRTSITAASRFYLASVSKQFTAASILLLAQEGRLSLDDDIRKYLPEMPDYGTPIRIRDLLHHTSGIRDYILLLSLGAGNPENVMSEDDVLALIARQKGLDFTPGTAHSYSNSGYVLLAIIVKRVSGTSLAAYADTHIFKPLGMRATQYHTDRFALIPHRAIGYSPGRDGAFRIDYYANFELVGDGGLWSTVDDLAKWDRNFYQPTVGGRALVSAQQTRGILANGDTIAYAAGLYVDDYRGLPTVEHGGSYMGYRTSFLRFPTAHFSVILLCNDGAVDSEGLAHKVADLYLARDFPPAPNAATSAAASGISIAHVSTDALRARAGLYQDTVTGISMELVVQEGQLAARMMGTTLKVVPASPYQFHSTADSPVPVDITFDNSGDHQNDHFRLVLGGQQTFTLTRFVRASPSPDQFLAYAGQYHSDELGTTYSVSVHADTLMVTVPGRDPARLTPTVRDTFTFSGMRIAFIRDHGRVTGLTVLAGRSRIPFVQIAR